MSHQLKPADPNFEERVRASFDRQSVMKHLKVAIHSIRPGEVVLEMPFQLHLTQQHGFMHAGIVSAIMDSACGYAAFSLMPPDAAVLSVEFKVNLLSPARGDRFRASARVVKPGRTISVVEAELHAHDSSPARLIATMTGTMMAVYGREGVEQ